MSSPRSSPIWMRKRRSPKPRGAARPSGAAERHIHSLLKCRQCACACTYPVAGPTECRLSWMISALQVYRLTPGSSRGGEQVDDGAVWVLRASEPDPSSQGTMQACSGTRDYHFDVGGERTHPVILLNARCTNVDGYIVPRRACACLAAQGCAARPGMRKRMRAMSPIAQWRGRSKCPDLKARCIGSGSGEARQSITEAWPATENRDGLR